jgi:hypothetical protein
MRPHFILQTWDANRRNGMGKHLLIYKLTMRENGKSVGLFAGDDFGCSPMHAIDSIATAEALMSFLTLRPGDTDADYFKAYTPQQLDYCARYAESLSAEVGARWCDEKGNLKKRYR